MSEDCRTIDIAKTASIDMMTLNNKVVNMRQTVKRAKVQVINKLCKNIASLKKKKGSDEQKTQNLKKAERFIEEIDSIKRLKEDKVSKYALANTTSFNDVCKISTSAGPRALARLTDHPLMKKAVTDFRSQHSDWRDLAAYLLVKQTGRRFKTKKQKQSKKLTNSVANIHASETMTKAYIQERFGKDGLTKAEQRFEMKRKREKSDEQKSPVSEMPVVQSEKEKSAEDRNISLNCEQDDVGSGEDQTEGDSNDADRQESGSEGENVIRQDREEAHKVTQDENLDESSLDSDDSVETSDLKNKKKFDKMIQNSESAQDDANLRLGHEEEVEVNAKESDRLTTCSSEKLLEEEEEKVEEPVPKKRLKRNECVIKELKIGKSEESSSSGSNSESDSDDSENDDDDEEDFDKDENGVDVDDQSDNDSSSNVSKRRKKKQDGKIPAFLKSQPKKPVQDPFFAGSDDDEGDDDEAGAFNDFDEALRYEPGDDEDEGGYGGRYAKSSFHNPHRGSYRRDRRGAERGRGGGRWERNRGGGRGGSWGDRGGRGGTWRDREGGRGGTWGDRGGRGGTWRDREGGRGGTWGDRGGGRGSSFRGSRGGDRGGSQSRRPAQQGRWSSDARPEKFDTSAQSTDLGTKPASAPAEKLHPSWEASKKRKAQQSGIQAFQGSKITFDDDD